MSIVGVLAGDDLMRMLPTDGDMARNGRRWHDGRMSQPQIQYVQVVHPSSNNGLALAAVILGIFASVVAFMAHWFLLALFPAAVLGLLAFIFGIVGVVTASRIGGFRRGAAVTGIVLGVLPFAFYWTSFLFFA